MIVDPDMPDHWKVQMLAGMLGDDQAAAVYLIRLWGHCQNRKKDRFDNLPAMALRAICKYQGDAGDLEAAMIECGFIERDGSTLVVIGWAEHNANLWSAWENGKKGGRPKKPAENPRDNPRDTGGSPDEVDEVDEGKGSGGKKPRKRAHAIPDDFPGKSEIEWANEKHPAVDAKHEAEQFREHAKANDRKMKDWPAAWRMWVGKAAQWQKERGGSAKKSPAWDTVLAVASRGSADRQRFVDEHPEYRDALNAAGGLKQIGLMNEWQQKEARERFNAALEGA